MLMENEPYEDKKNWYDTSALNKPESIEVAEEKTLVVDVIDPPLNKKHFHKDKISKRQILLVTVLLLLLAISVAGLVFINNSVKKTPTSVVVNTQSLDNGTLNQLQSNSDGSSRQQLTINPETIFKNDIIVQGSIKAVQNLIVGGKVDVQGETSIKDSLTVGKSLSVGSNLTVNGLITAGSLSVGSITISSINISGDLLFSGHLVPSGSQPKARASVASASGGVTISGNDTAGTITITAGNGRLLPGELAVITFIKAYGATPKVQITPSSAGASELKYFVTQSATFFTINTVTAPSANVIYSFNYMVTQ